MKNKLELTWFNKDKSLWYNMKEGKYIWVDKNDPRVAEPRILIEKKHYGDLKAENLLIKGDNLLALKALQPEFTGKIKLVYIDPPFNTGTAFEHYDDGLEHSIWLTMMRDRLEIMKDLLSEDGAIFIHIDDNEQAHLKILLDKIFRTAINRAELFRKIKKENRFSWHTTKKGNKILIFHGEQVLFAKDKLVLERGQLTPVELLGDIWLDIGINNLANEGNIDFRFGKKPEKLIWRLIDMMTTENDYVLDSFAGSGTTGAVAYKMKRKWIMVELGEHAETHCIKRLKNVISGKDSVGVTKEVNWKGGGGFKYCVLGESLFKFDPKLELFPFINTMYTNGPLIRAVCKMEGFYVISTKGPLHGQVNKRYAHITEQFVNQTYIEELEKEITNEESLVIYCLRHDSKIILPENVSIKRMPMVLIKKFVMSG